MNRFSHFLGLKNTFYDNPHGLANIENVHFYIFFSLQFQLSSALDVAKLSRECFSKFSLFGEIVNCKEYQSKALSKQGALRSYIWKNTNRLLEKGFHGIKTGITENAGPCLAAAYK